MNLNIYIITCDEAQHILPTTIYFLNKYFYCKLKIIILGYTKPEYIFPNNVDYVELKNGEKRNKNTWLKDIYNYFNNIDDEYVIFSVDDVPVIDYVNLDYLNTVIEFMKKNNTIIINGGIFSTIDVIQEYMDFDICRVDNNFGHKTNLQMNIWNKKALMDVLYKIQKNDLVSFEHHGFDYISSIPKNDNSIITLKKKQKYNKKSKYCLFPVFQWGFLSESKNKGNINILGLSSTDVDYIIKNKLVDVNKLTYSDFTQYKVPYNIFNNNITFDKLNEYIKKMGYKPRTELIEYCDISPRDTSNELIIRTNNLLTNKNTMEHLFQIEDYPVSLSSIDKDYTNIKTMDMVFEICKETGIIQVRNAPPLNDIYINAHNSSYGKVWNNLFEEFKLLINNYNFKTILEIGGGSLMLADKILKNNSKINNYTVYEVNSTIKHTTDTRINLIQEYFTKDTILDKSYDFIIHSHVLEHVWDPVEFINVISNVLDNNNYHGFIVPNLKSTLTKKYANSLNFEHNFFIIEDYIDVILYNCGLKILEKKYYLDHSILYITQKESISNIISKPYPNLYTENRILAMDWINYNTNIVNNFNNQLQDFDGEVYLFGATNFAILLIKLGLNIDKVIGILDNCKQKEGQKVYGCDFIIQNPVIIQNKEKVAVVLKAASYQEEIKEQLIQLNANVLIIEE